MGRDNFKSNKPNFFSGISFTLAGIIMVVTIVGFLLSSCSTFSPLPTKPKQTQQQDSNLILENDDQVSADTFVESTEGTLDQQEEIQNSIQSQKDQGMKLIKDEEQHELINQTISNNSQKENNSENISITQQLPFDIYNPQTITIRDCKNTIELLQQKRKFPISLILLIEKRCEDVFYHRFALIEEVAYTKPLGEYTLDDCNFLSIKLDQLLRQGNERKEDIEKDILERERKINEAEQETDIDKRNEKIDKYQDAIEDLEDELEHVQERRERLLVIRKSLTMNC